MIRSLLVTVAMAGAVSALMFGAVALDGPRAASPAAASDSGGDWYRVDDFRGFVCETGREFLTGRVASSVSSPGDALAFDRIYYGGGTVEDNGDQVIVNAANGYSETFYRGRAACESFLAGQRAEENRYK